MSHSDTSLESSMGTWAGRILRHHWNLDLVRPLPGSVEWLDSYGGTETRRVMSKFYQKFYGDGEPRTLLLGINPGRFGAGVTGVPFTDPIRLELACGIPNDFDKKREISSIFIYEMIDAFGGPESFYRKYLISSLCPEGFLKGGRNYNYYDDNELLNTVKPLICANIETLLGFGASSQVAYCLGKGKNAKFFKVLNAEFRYFDRIVVLPHPRWVMQYRLKEMTSHLDAYLAAL